MREEESRKESDRLIYRKRWMDKIYNKVFEIMGRRDGGEEVIRE